ncbi:MAG: hypothetical protein ACKOEC_02595 [Acidimicrobiia bacterium]
MNSELSSPAEPNAISIGPASVSALATAAPRSSSRSKAPSRSAVVAKFMITRTDLPDVSAARTALSVLPADAETTVSALNASDATNSRPM